ncbi:MAG TPA: primosomal protein N' [Chitinophagales bacterium]|nr:primosomal protein N' [Chitinophagales bacterium]
MPIYAQVILPLALSGQYTYEVPPHLATLIMPGQRVEVQFGQKRMYAAIVTTIFTQTEQPDFAVKQILNILDEQPILPNTQLLFWQWIADYYMCPEGEVMNAALPSAFKLSSETKLELNPGFNHDLSLLSDEEYLTTEALTNKPEIAFADVQLILNRKNVFGIIKSLLEKGVILVKEELIERYKPKTETFISLAPEWQTDKALQELFDKLSRATKQMGVLMAYIQLKNEQKNPLVLQKAVYERANAQSADVQNLLKKGYFVKVEKVVSRIKTQPDDNLVAFTLSAPQQTALQQIKNHFQQKNVVLLHGVTSSGKTQIYLELIKETIQQEKQALFLLPEIALTAQLINRLRSVLGNDVGVYHSKFNDQERIEIWHKVLSGQFKVILGARSALFLPFQNLGLVIVDEEHDPSFKQDEPAPRYHARDSAIYLAGLFKAKTLLGSATPAFETYHNAVQLKKYGLVTLTTRFGDVEPPLLELVNIKDAEKNKQLQANFSRQLLAEMHEALARKEQIILFQNRRGYSPYVSCDVCEYTPQCPHCDVSLTYHKFAHELKCHYCGYKIRALSACPKCKSTHITQHGFGTEKIEDDITALCPGAKIARLDSEVARTKTGSEKIITAFENKEADILVGTQMVTKGLDFDNVNVVGILSADQLINFPDFRAAERAFQIIMQVSGRAGRRAHRGKVLIQTKNPNYAVLRFALQNNYEGFYTAEMYERSKYGYPPFSRLVLITLKHPDNNKLNDAAFELAKALKNISALTVLGPSVPPVSRVRNYYLRQILLKIDKNQALTPTKHRIAEILSLFQADKNNRQVIVVTNVDPY